MGETSRPWSLRSRLLIIATLASLGTLLAGSAAMYWAASREDARLRDSRLEDLAQTVLAFSEHEIGEIIGDGRTEMMHAETAATLGTRYRYQIWTQHGSLLLHSFNALKEPMTSLRDLGHRDVDITGEGFRVFSMRANNGEMVIQVAERANGSETPISVVGGYFVVFLVIPFAFIFTATWWSLRHSLHSIDSSAAQLSQRSPIDLTPVVAKNPPAELRPMIDSINTLFGRINRTLSLERGFTAVAAHELRTPLAGLRAQAQIAATADSPAELKEALGAVMQGVDRAAHLLDQLLDLTRMESLHDETDHLLCAVDVEQLQQSVMVDLEDLAQRRRVQMDTDFAEPTLFGIEAGLALLLRNLLGNAIRYTPSGGLVIVRTYRSGQALVLSVDDSGPGIAPELRQRAFDRFDRLGLNDPGGVGLGMSIVRSAVLAHRADIRLLQSPLGGLRVEVRFPQTSAARKAPLSAPATRLPASEATDHKGWAGT